jgi:alcohol dehydrogenase class IV
MAIKEQVFGFFIPTVTLMGIGAHKEIGKQIKALGGKNPFICTDQGIVDAGILDKIVQVIQKIAKWSRWFIKGLNQTLQTPMFMKVWSFLKKTSVI